MDDFSGLEYDQESVSEDVVVMKTNGLLSHFNLPTQVSSVNDITASLFVVLYESLFSDRLPGIVRQPVTKEDEIQNCQMVIDVLSADVIKDNLSHIRGTDIVGGKLQSINNLLDIFCFLYEYVIKQIESDVPTDTDDDVGSVDQHQPLQVHNLEKNFTDAAHGFHQITSAANGGMDFSSPSPFSRPTEFSGATGASVRAGIKIGNGAGSEIGYRADSGAGNGYKAGKGAGSGYRANDGASNRYRAEQCTGNRYTAGQDAGNGYTASKGAVNGYRLDQGVGNGYRAGKDAGYGYGGSSFATSDIGNNADIGAGNAARGFLVQEKNALSSSGAYGRNRGELLPHLMSAPSPIHPNDTSSLMGQGTFDSTAELMQEVKKFESRFIQGESKFSSVQPALEQEVVTGKMEQYEVIRGRPASTTAATYCRPDQPKTASVRRNDMASSEPLSFVPRPSSTEELRSTLGSFPFQGRLTSEKPFPRELGIKGLSSSYGDLHSMVQQTAAMTRAAIEKSPLCHRREQDKLNITDLSHERQRIPQSEAQILAQELNLGSPSLARPLVSESIEGSPLEAHPFAVGDSLEVRSLGKEARQLYPDSNHKAGEGVGAELLCVENIPPQIQTIPPNTDYRPEVRTQLAPRVERKRSDKEITSSHTVPDSYKDIYTRQSDKELDCKNKRKERYAGLLNLCELSEIEENAHVRDACGQKTPVKNQAKLSTKLDQMGMSTLANVERRLETENKVYSARQEYLKKLYEEEFGDVVEEVKHLMSKDKELMTGMEDEYRKLMMMAGNAQPTAKRTKPGKPKGYLLPSTKRVKSAKVPKSVEKKSLGGAPHETHARSLTLGESDELMPILLEEFPHLHMSDHTWHELWRRGLKQIENLTRAYEENKRRKSSAQLQLEEAARKHEVLAAIVKKQIDHNHRMGQVKDNKRQQVMTRNKIYEKRVQSARARRCYNEYQVRSRSKMLKRRTKEELIFKNLFKDGLAIQKEKIQDVQRYAKEQREKMAEKRQNEIDSLENYYRDQFELLVGRLIKDREEMKAREQAHHKVLEVMKRDLRKKMEKEIANIQNEMFRDDDDTYFRQLEADRLRKDLQMAKYQARI